MAETGKRNSPNSSLSLKREQIERSYNHKAGEVCPVGNKCFYLWKHLKIIGTK